MHGDPTKVALSWAERERQRWLARPLTDEEAEVADGIKFDLCLDARKFPNWGRKRTNTVEDIHDIFADKHGQELFSILLEAVLEGNPKLARETLEEAIAILAKCRVRDRA